jgi:hypothetical protein
LLWSFWRWGLANCLHRLALILPISASQLARIIGVSHQTLARKDFLFVIPKAQFTKGKHGNFISSECKIFVIWKTFL